MVPISTQMILKFPIMVGKNNLKVLDQGWLEICGGQGLFDLISQVFKKYIGLQASFITVHLSIIIIILVYVIFGCLNSLNISVTLKLLR